MSVAGLKPDPPRRIGILWAAVLLLPGLSPTPALSASPPTVSRGNISDLEIVDCLLPPQVRQLGNTTYLTDRRPTHTTASDCRIRGGEYTAFDRANMDTALKVWLAAAQAGSAEAQTMVGDIFSRGLGGAPDYQLAATWYQKAADQNDPRAQTDLGLLYEQGLGVDKDVLKALNLYRLAAGIKSQDSLVMGSALDSLRRDLEGTIAQLNQQIDVLKMQIESLSEKLRQQSAQSQDTAEIKTLRTLVAELQKQRDTTQDKLGALAVRTPRPNVTAPEPDPLVPARTLRGMNLGRYYALLIGEQNYAHVGTLATPLSDVEQVAKVLQSKYGFTVDAVKDGNGYEILEALDNYARKLKPDDNLLLYYAGHGSRQGSAPQEFGYWLPTDADPPPKAVAWIPNAQVTAYLARIPAKRILVMADSCYAGLLSKDPGELFLPQTAPVTMSYVNFRLAHRARLLISSGGDEPVLDGGGSGNSVFARAVVDALTANNSVLSAPGLFVDVQSRVKKGASRSGFRQVPEFKAITDAGHEIGDFFFVPQTAN